MNFSKKSTFLLLISILFLGNLQAQFGLSIYRDVQSFSDWESDRTNQNTGPSQSLLPSGTEVGIDYWFRPKNFRVEFLPQFAFSTSSTAIPTATVVDKYSMEGFHLRLNTHIYFMDLLGDCDCPTFSKDSNILKKGLFVHLGPSVSYYSNTMDFVDSERKSYKTNNSQFNVNLGLGVDIGISNLITISPIIKYAFVGQANWRGLYQYQQEMTPSENDIEDAKSSFQKFQFGIRVGIRADYKH